MNKIKFELRSFWAALCVLFVSATAFVPQSYADAMSYTGAISEKVNLGWTGVTFDDLYKMVYTNREGTKSTQIRKEDDCVKFVIGNNQSEIILEINENGFVTAMTSKGIYDLLAEPAVASIKLPDVELGAGVGGEPLVYDQGLPAALTTLPWVIERSVLATYTFTLGDEVGVVTYSDDTFGVTFKNNYLTLAPRKNNVMVMATYATDKVLTATPPSAGATRVQGVVNYASFAEALVAAKGTEKVLVLDASAIPEGTEVTEDPDGAYLTIKEGYSVDAEGNVIPLQKLYYVSDATNWTSDLKVANSKNGEATIATKVGDIVTFDKGGEFGPIYIHGKTAEKVPVAGFEVLSGTLKVGYEGGNSSIPEGWVVTVADGAAVQFDNWADGVAVKVMDATFNGEGAIRFGSTITRSSAVTFGTIKGDATITIPDGVTVTATSIANPVVLELGAELKSKNPITDISAANGNVIGKTVDTEDNNYVYTVKEAKVVYYKSGYIGNETSLKLTETSGGSEVEYEEAAKWDIVIDSNSPANAWAAKSYKYDGHDINVSKFIIEKNFTFKNGANQDGIFDGITFEIATGATLTLADSAANQKMTLGAANFIGAGSVDISGVSTWTTITAAEGLSVTYAEGLKVKTETTDGVTTYTVSSAPTSWNEVDETTTLEEVVPAAQAEALAKHNVTTTQIKAWVDSGKMYGVTIEFNPAAEIDLEAFALGTYTEYKDFTKANFKLSLRFDESGTPVPELPAGFVDICNIRPVIMGSTDLKEWHEKKAGDMFFKAVIDL